MECWSEQLEGTDCVLFLISNFRHVLNVVCFLLGSETSAYKIQMPGNYPEESTQQTVSCITRAEVDCVDANTVDR
jgi:hypothetical protein